MNLLRSAIIAAGLTAGLIGGASAMPIGDLSRIHSAMTKPEQIRMVYDDSGRCYPTPRRYRHVHRYRYGVGYGFTRHYRSGPVVTMGFGPHYGADGRPHFVRHIYW